MGGGALEVIVFNIFGDYILLFEADESCGASPQGKNIVYAHKYNTNFVGVHWPPSLSTEYPKLKIL